MQGLPGIQIDMDGWPAAHQQCGTASCNTAAAAAAASTAAASASSLPTSTGPRFCLPTTPPPAQEAYAEAEADLAAGGKKGGAKRRRKGGEPAAAAGEAGDDEDAFFSSLSAQGRLPKFVELLKFKVHCGDTAGGAATCGRVSRA